MYQIVFRDDTCPRMRFVYGGGSFIYQREKYAVLNSLKPKLFKSEAVARNAAEKLLASCVNTGDSYDIEEVDEEMFFEKE